MQLISQVLVHTQKYLEGRFIESNFTEDQVQAIADCAIKTLKDSLVDNASLKRNSEIDCTLLNKALDEIIISSSSPWAPNKERLHLTPRQELVFTLMRGGSPKIEKILTDGPLLAAVLAKQDDTIFFEVRDLIHKIFFDMHLQLLEHPLKTESENFHMEMIIGDLLALLPFLNLTSESTIKIPLRLGDPKTWEYPLYAIEPLFLTPSWMGSPITAFGLTPHDNSIAAPPLILFKGTTYPSDKGFGLSLLTDLTPFESVGSYVYSMGKETIKSWLESHAKNQKAIVIGKSLGGIVASMVAMDFYAFIEKVISYGAPGFSSQDLNKFYRIFDEVKKNNEPFPETHAFYQKNDPVLFCDFPVDRGIHYYLVVGSKIRKGVLAHADMYSTHIQSMILKIDPSKESFRIFRIATTTLRAGLSFFAFPFILMIHMTYVATRQATCKLFKKAQPPSRL